MGLEETINNVISQTYPNIEYIIIDGKSTDGTLDIINKYKNNITYWISEPDEGIFDAMNKGIDSATGDWINFMNAGDIFYHSNVLMEIFSLKDLENSDVLYGKTERRFKHISLNRSRSNLKEFWKGMQFSHQSTFFTTSVHKKHKYNIQYKFAGDFDVIYNLFNANKIFTELDIIVSIKKVDGTTYSNIIKSTKERYSIVLKTDSTLRVRIYYLILFLKYYIRQMVPLPVMRNYYAIKYKNHININ